MAEAWGCLSGYGRQFLHDYGRSVFPQAVGWDTGAGEKEVEVLSVEEVSERTQPFSQGLS